MFGIALYGFNKIGDKVESALVLHFNLSPLLLKIFIEGYEAIAGTDVVSENTDDSHNDYNCYDYWCLLHNY